MIVEKNGVTYVLTDRTQIDAFLTSGWKPVEEPPVPESPSDTDTELPPANFESAPEGDGQEDAPGDGEGAAPEGDGQGKRGRK